MGHQSPPITVPPYNYSFLQSAIPSLFFLYFGLLMFSISCADGWIRTVDFWGKLIAEKIAPLYIGMQNVHLCPILLTFYACKLQL